MKMYAIDRGDDLLLLAQIIAHVAPDRLPTFLAKHLEGQRRRDRSLSWEALVVGAIGELAGQVHGGVLLLDVLGKHVNAGRNEKERLSNRRTSDVLKSLGLETRKAGHNKAALVWDAAKIDTLVAHYAETVSEKREDNPPDVPPADANKANNANPAAPPEAPPAPPAADPVSKVSIVSDCEGHATSKNSNILRDEANPRRKCQDCDKPLPPGDGIRCLNCELRTAGYGARR